MAATAKQKAATAKFKLAVAYKKKHPGLTQKQAFAHIYGKRVLNAPVKKKKTITSRMNTKSKIAAVPKKKIIGSAVRKTVSRSAPVKKAVGIVSKYSIASRIKNPQTNVPAVQKMLMKLLTGKLGNLESDKFMARTKTEKNKISKMIRETKSQLTHLKKYL